MQAAGIWAALRAPRSASRVSAREEAIPDSRKQEHSGDESSGRHEFRGLYRTDDLPHAIANCVGDMMPTVLAGHGVDRSVSRLRSHSYAIACRCNLSRAQHLRRITQVSGAHCAERTAAKFRARRFRRFARQPTCTCLGWRLHPCLRQLWTIVTDLVKEAARPLTRSGRDYDPLARIYRDARFVLLGEASHGTHEFYRERAQSPSV